VIQEGRAPSCPQEAGAHVLVSQQLPDTPPTPASSPSSSPHFDQRRKKTQGAQAQVFECPAQGCHLRYRRRGDLKIHVIIKHAEDPSLPAKVAPAKSSKVGKPYCCPHTDCPSGYARHSDLVRHLEKKHGRPAASAPAIEDESQEGSWPTDY